MFRGRISLCCVFGFFVQDRQHPFSAGSLILSVRCKKPVSFQVYLSYQLQLRLLAGHFSTTDPHATLKNLQKFKTRPIFVCSFLCCFLFVDVNFLVRQNEQTLNGHCTKESASSKVCLVKGASTVSDNAQSALSISSTVYASNPDSFASFQHSWSGWTR